MSIRRRVEVVVPTLQSLKRTLNSEGSVAEPGSSKRRRIDTNSQLRDNGHPSTSNASSSTLGVSRAGSVMYPEDTVEEELISELLGEDQATDGTRPVRRLANFAIHSEDLAYVNAGDLLLRQDPNADSDALPLFFASGEVRPLSDTNFDYAAEELYDQDEYASNVVKSAKVGPITRLNVHHFDDTDGLDGNIYILTTQAWYVLDTASEDYLPHYRDFFIKQRCLHIMLFSVLSSPDFSMEDLLSELPTWTDEDLVPTERVLDRQLNMEDFEESQSYVLSTVPDLCEHIYELISHPLIRAYFRDARVLDDLPARPKNVKQRLFPKKSKSKKSDGSTEVTPTVWHHCQHLFRTKLSVRGVPVEEEEKEEALAKRLSKKVKTHHDNPERIEWGERGTHERYYSSVSIDGEIYRPGDIVMVMPNVEETSLSKNMYAKRYWFCLIRYFFEEDERKQFHAQWFEHGSRTILQEVAPSQTLYLMDGCDTLALESVIQKANVTFNRDPELADALEKEIATDCADFTCSFMWDPELKSFRDLRDEKAEKQLLSVLPSHEPCPSCALKEEAEAKKMLGYIPDGITLFGNEYHVNDCVYIKSTTSLLDIAQITALPLTTDEHVSVKYLGRMDVKVPLQKDESYFAQERELYVSRKTNLVDASSLQGHCYVKYIKPTNLEEIRSWTAHDDHFYVCQFENSTGLIPLHPVAFQQCARQCLTERQLLLKKEKSIQRMISPLRGLELFAGCGGLGTGMDLSRAVETKWAVEYWEPAAKTYEFNHPETTVYPQDANTLLAKAIHPETHTNVKSRLDGKVLPDMPKKGEVDFIFGGPPCQAFSKANHHPDPDDVRSTLIMAFLSFVEFYEPKYFLIENVTGILRFPLMGSLKAHGRSLEGGIEMGVVKLVYLISLSLGYQIHVKVLQAGSYGVPQSRERVIFLGARRGLPLPEFPLPTHAFPRIQRQKLGGLFYQEKQQYLVPPTRSPNPEDIHPSAPLRNVTVNGAISDLPKFDWKNPHILLPATPGSRADDQARRSENIAVFTATNSMSVVGYESITYHSPPQTAFQDYLRAKGLTIVKDHQTRAYSNMIVEASVNVPLAPNATHRNIPQCLLSGQKMLTRKDTVYYGRIDGDRYFRTAMTSISPRSSGSVVLHPTQKRCVTVREAARAQGFPDDYVFQSTAEKKAGCIVDQYKQIGNAVPVPLALALGKCLGAVMIKAQRNEERAGSPVL